MTTKTEPRPTRVERMTDRELVITRRFDAPAWAVFKAWTMPDLMKRWWVPEGFGMVLESIEIDARTGGTYRLVFSHPDFPEPMAFFGTYLEVVQDQKIVWTNEEGGENGQVTTLTLTEEAGTTLLVQRELYPSKEALDDAIASGATGASEIVFGQLDGVLAQG